MADETLAEHFAGLAKHFRAKALEEKSRENKAEMERLAECYMQIANASVRNCLSDIVHRQAEEA